MKAVCNAAALMAVVLAQGCAVYAPAADGPSIVRQVMAAQTLPPVQRPDTPVDSAAAVAAYGNYQRSFVTPVPQSDSAAFGGK